MRVYNEEEVQRLLRQASALQAAKRDFTTGLTLDEIRRVAEEAGIDPHYVEQAALGAPPPLQPQKAGVWGGAYTLEQERMLGHEVDAEEWGEMVHEIRRTYGTLGEVREVGRGFEWMHGYPQYGSEFVYGHVSVTPRRGRTRLHAKRKLSNESTIFILPFVFLIFSLLLFIPAFSGKMTVLAPVLAVLFSLLTFAGARAWFGNKSREAQQKMEELLTRLEQIAGESEAYAAEQVPEAAAEGRLDPDLLDAAADDLDAADQRASRTPRRTSRGRP